MDKSWATNEAKRLLELKRYKILDTQPDSMIDNITQAAADICCTPIALVSLVDPTRQWFKAKVGLLANETPRTHSFCTHAIEQPHELMMVPDATKDSRFVDNPLVTGDPNIRFYAGKPLVTPNGYALGTLCVIDREPRQLTLAQQNALSRLADVVVGLFDQYEKSMASSIILALEQALNHGITITDPNQENNPMVYCNMAFESLTGYTEAELLGENCRVLQGKYTDPNSIKMLSDAISDEREVTVILKNYRKDGSEFWNEVTVAPVRDGGGNTTNFVGFQKDVSERFKIEAALSQSRAFLESAPDAMIISNEAGEIKMANTEAIKLFGYSHEELAELNISELSAVPFRGIVKARRRAIINGTPAEEPSSGLELMGLTKSGEEILIDVRLSLVTTDDGVLFSSSVRDASTRAETERLLTKSKERSEDATKTKSRFLAAASHDLRQPLQSISMYMSLLELQKEMPDEAKELCGEAGKSLGVMSRLLDTLLDISKLDAGSITPEKRDLSIRDILDNIVASSQPQADKKGLSIICEPCDQMVHTDPVLLERIIGNFVTNAVRYTNEGHVAIICTLRDKDMLIDINDTGIGMPADKLDTVFEEYYQLDNPARERKRGLGLGLSIAKLISKLLDHPLKVSSELGVGSTFSVLVPLGTNKPTSVPISISSSETSQQEAVILLVDDDDDVIRSIARLLRAFNLEVHTALNGDEALAKISNGLSPDFLISDFRLPLYDGIELVQRVRAALGWEVPTVMVTGDTSSSKIRAARLSNFNVLDKPFDAKELLEIINSRTQRKPSNT
jgi:PAS domain S-box-containing protein